MCSDLGVFVAPRLVSMQIFEIQSCRTQVQPGTRRLEGQYINDQGRVEPWVAHYDEYGRMVGRTDYNAGNMAAGIPSTHYHSYEYGPGRNGAEIESHVPGEFPW
jgi:hypothetical protein